jgi:hypothetical protein
VQHVGHHERHGAVLILLGGEVGQPGAEEPGGVVQIRSRRREHLDVTGPAEPLVALRAVDRHVEEVAAHRPDDVVVEPVEQRVRGGEPTGAAEVSANHDGFQVGRRQVGHAVQLGVAETVEGQRRLEQLLLVAGDKVGVGGLGAAQREGGQLSALQHLGVPDGHGRPGSEPAHGDPGPADEVLPEIDQRAASRRLPYLPCGDHLGDPHRGSSGRDQAVQAPGDHLDRRGGKPLQVRPAAQVGVLAVEEVVGNHLALPRPPGGVGPEYQSAAVGEGHFQLREQREPVAVGRDEPEPEPASEPTIAEQELEAVRADPELVGHVVGLVAQPVTVCGPTWGQDVVTDPAAVEGGHVHAMRSGVKPRGLHRTGDVECARHQGRRLFRCALRGRTDEARLPVGGGEQAGLGGGRWTPVAPVVAVGDPDPDRHRGPGREVRRRPWHQDLVRAVDAVGGRRVRPGDLDLVRGLLVPGLRGRRRPGQPRPGRAESKHRCGVGAVLESGRRGGRGVGHVEISLMQLR